MESIPNIFSEISIRVGDLETLILSIQSSVQHSINLLIGLIGLAVALLSITGFSSIKSLVNKKFENFYEKNKDELVKDVIRDKKMKRGGIVFEPTFTMGAMPYNNYNCTYGILEDRFVYLDAKIVFKGVGREITMFPVQLRPIDDTRFIVSIHELETNKISVGHVEINKDGKLKILTDIRNESVIHLQNIVFKTNTDII